MCQAKEIPFEVPANLFTMVQQESKKSRQIKSMLKIHDKLTAAELTFEANYKVDGLKRIDYWLPE